MKSVSILIPNWNGRQLLERFIGSVVDAAERYRAESGADVELIIIDDASTDNSCEWLRGNFGLNDAIRIIELERNLGFLRAVNKGFESAKNHVVFLLNNDVSVEAGCIVPLISHFEDESIFAVCCRANRIGSDRLDGAGKIGGFERGFWRVFLNYEVDPSETSSELISFFGTGGYTAYDREKWKEIGGFYECLSPNYWEDVEIGYRAWKRGWKINYEPEAKVHHLGSASMKRKNSREIGIVSERNRLLMTWINLHDRRMCASHILWLGLKLIGSTFSLDWNYFRSFRRALAKLSKVRELRRIERNAALISDRALADKFRELAQRPEIYVLRDESAEIAFREMQKSRASTPATR